MTIAADWDIKNQTNLTNSRPLVYRICNLSTNIGLISFGHGHLPVTPVHCCLFPNLLAPYLIYITQLLLFLSSRDGDFNKNYDRKLVTKVSLL